MNKRWTRLELRQILKNCTKISKQKAWLRDPDAGSKAKPKPVPARAPVAQPRTCWRRVRSRGSPRRPRRPGSGLLQSLAFAGRWAPASARSPRALWPPRGRRQPGRRRSRTRSERRAQHGSAFPLRGLALPGRTAWPGNNPPADGPRVLGFRAVRRAPTIATKGQAAKERGKKEKKIRPTSRAPCLYWNYCSSHRTHPLRSEPPPPPPAPPRPGRHLPITAQLTAHPAAASSARDPPTRPRGPGLPRRGRQGARPRGRARRGGVYRRWFGSLRLLAFPPERACPGLFVQSGVCSFTCVLPVNTGPTRLYSIS